MTPPRVSDGLTDGEKQKKSQKSRQRRRDAHLLSRAAMYPEEEKAPGFSAEACMWEGKDLDVQGSGHSGKSAGTL